MDRTDEQPISAHRISPRLCAMALKLISMLLTVNANIDDERAVIKSIWCETYRDVFMFEITFQYKFVVRLDLRINSQFAGKRFKKMKSQRLRSASCFMYYLARCGMMTLDSLHIECCLLFVCVCDTRNEQVE